MKFHDFSPFYRSSEGIKPKVSGDRLLDNPLVADVQSGASFKFDGSNDVVSIADSDNLSFGNGVSDSAFSITAWVNMRDATQFEIAAKGVYNTNPEWHFYFDGSDQLRIGIFDSSTGPDDAYHDIYTAALTSLESEWAHVAATYNGVGGTSADEGLALYVNGVLQSVSSSGSGTYVAMENLGASVTIGNNGASTYAEGEIRQVRIHNRALSADEVRAAYSGQAVPYEYVGASQTNLVYNTFTNDVFSNGWTAQGPTVTYDSSDGRVNFASASGSSGSYHGMYYTFGSAPEGNKKYRYSYDVVNHSEGTHAISIGNGTYSTASEGNGTFTGVIESPSDPDKYVRLYAQTSGTGNSFGINSVSITQIGCVAEYLPSGINSTRWMDTSGNGLHGSTSTATAVNHKIGSLTLATLSTDAVRFDHGQASGATTAESLDHYEEGTWTPVLNFTTTQITSYHNQYGFYTRIGNRVFLEAFIQINLVGSASGDASITGLPFRIKNPHSYGGVSIYAVGVSSSGQFNLHTVVNDTSIALNEIADDGTRTSLNAANFGNSSQVIISVQYPVETNNP